MESTNNNGIDLSKKETYKKQLAKLECPFTWNMDDINETINTEHIQSPHKEENPLPLQKLMKTVMKVYLSMKNDKKNRDDIIKNLEECDQYYKMLIDSADINISTTVANAVLQATKCFVYLILDMEQELELVLKNLENIGNLNTMEKSTLLACKSICWTRFRRHGSYEGEKLIREAIALNEDCDLWHFVLGKILRRQRRDSSISGIPNREEACSFLKAYAMSDNPIYGIFVAQMYRESRNYRKAMDMYNDIFKNFDSLSNTILLRLALGFMNQKQFGKAKACLDRAEEVCPKRSMYLHYRGIYHLKKGEYKEAIPFYEKAIKEDNLPAEKQYLQCLMNSNEVFDATQYLEDMVNKWRSKLPDEQMQPLILDVAFSYWKGRNWVKAIENFLYALEIDQKARCLTNCYSNYALRIQERNVYGFLKQTFLCTIDQQLLQFDEATSKKVEAIREYCKLYYKALINTVKNELTDFGLRK